MAQRPLGVPAGPLAAYLGVRGANEDDNMEGIGLLARIQAVAQENQRRADELKMRGQVIEAKLREEGQQATERDRRAKAVSDLAGLLRTGGYKPAAGAAPLTGVALTDQEALGRVMEAEKAGLPANIGVPNPNTVRSLALQSNPDKAIPELLRQERQPAPMRQPATKTINTAQGVFRINPDGSHELLLDANGKPLMPPSMAGGGLLTPETLSFTAKQYLAGDRQAIAGFARSGTARIALQNAIREEAEKQGKTPEQVAAAIAEYAGLTAGSRTVGQRAANISLAATEALEMIDIVRETSDKFARTNFVPWNVALRAYETGTGSPEVTDFGAAVNALVNVYARAINPTGVPTVSDKEHARSVINTVQSPAQVNGVLGIINKELSIAKRAPEQVRQGIRQSIAPSASGSGVPQGVDPAVWNVMTPQEKALWQR